MSRFKGLVFFNKILNKNLFKVLYFFFIKWRYKVTVTIFTHGRETAARMVKDWYSDALADRAMKRAKRVHESLSKWPYRPHFTDSLERVDVAGKAILNNAQSLQIVRANGVGLYNSIVSDEVNAGRGNCKVVDSQINNNLFFGGRTIVVQSSKINSFYVFARSRQTIKIRDTAISILFLPDGKMAYEIGFIKGDLYYKNTAQNFTLVLKNVTIEEFRFS